MKKPPMITHDKSKAPTAESVFIGELIGGFNDEDLLINEKLAELDGKCNEIAKNNIGKDIDYAIKIIRKICNEIALLRLSVVPDRPFPKWYSYDSQLLRNVAS